MNTKQLEELGISPIKGGRAAVVSGQVTSSHVYDAPDGKSKRASVTVSFFGDSIKAQVDTDHPLARVPEGKDVMIGYQWTDSVYQGTYKPRISNVVLLNNETK